jgi:hypothetical protein
MIAKKTLRGLVPLYCRDWIRFYIYATEIASATKKRRRTQPWLCRQRTWAAYDRSAYVSFEQRAPRLPPTVHARGPLFPPGPLVHAPKMKRKFSCFIVARTVNACTGRARVEAVKSTDWFVLCTHARAPGVHYTVLIFFRARALLIKEPPDHQAPCMHARSFPLLFSSSSNVRTHTRSRAFAFFTSSSNACTPYARASSMHAYDNLVFQHACTQYVRMHATSY